MELLKNELLKKYLMWCGIVANSFICGLCLIIIFASSARGLVSYTPDTTETIVSVANTNVFGTMYAGQVQESSIITKTPTPQSTNTSVPAIETKQATPRPLSTKTPTRISPVDQCYLEMVATDGEYAVTVYLIVSGKNAQVACDLLIEEAGSPKTDENGITSYVDEVNGVPAFPVLCEQHFDSGITVKIVAENEIFGNAVCKSFGTSSALSMNNQGDVFIVSNVPTDWKVCVNNARVYSNPGDNSDWYLYSLGDETPVQVRELDAGTRTWAMIQVANWIKFTDLCSL